MLTSRATDAVLFQRRMFVLQHVYTEHTLIEFLLGGVRKKSVARLVEDGVLMMTLTFSDPSARCFSGAFLNVGTGGDERVCCV